MKKIEIMDVEKAKEVLEEAGYFVENLWQVEDVMNKYKCTEDEAQEVLYDALTNEATMDRIWFAINFHAETMNLKEKEDE